MYWRPVIGTGASDELGPRVDAIVIVFGFDWGTNVGTIWSRVGETVIDQADANRGKVLKFLSGRHGNTRSKVVVLDTGGREHERGGDVWKF